MSFPRSPRAQFPSPSNSGARTTPRYGAVQAGTDVRNYIAYSPASSVSDVLKQESLLDDLLLYASHFVPISLTYTLYVVPTIFVLVYYGAQKEASLYLAMFGIARPMYTIFAYSIGWTMLGALVTIIPQAIGGGNTRVLRENIRRGYLFAFLSAIPSCACLAFADRILIGIGQPRNVSIYAGRYLRLSIIGYVFEVLQAPNLNLFQALKWTRAMFMCQCISPIGCAFALQIFPFFIKDPLAVGVLSWSFGSGLMYLTSICVLSYYGHGETFCSYVSMRAICDGDDIRKYCGLAIPAGLQASLEWYALEVMVLIAGWLPNGQLVLAAVAISANLQAIMYLLWIGAGYTLNTFVGLYIGEGDAAKARKWANLGIYLSIISPLVLNSILFCFRFQIGRVFTYDKEVIELFADLMSVVCITEFFDSVNGSMTGILRGSGCQKIGFWTNLIGYYVVGFPVVLGLLFGAGFQYDPVWGPRMLWFVLGLAMMVACGLNLIYMKFWMDWDDIVRKCEERLGIRHNVSRSDVMML